MNARRPYIGTCLTGGVHTPGSQWQRECPLRMAEARSERSRRAALTRGRAVAGPAIPSTPSDPLRTTQAPVGAPGAPACARSPTHRLGSSVARADTLAEIMRGVGLEPDAVCACCGAEVPRSARGAEGWGITADGDPICPRCDRECR